jgi:hydroxymethylpyrimidine/phosphomethylpyrimidine kinase
MKQYTRVLTIAGSDSGGGAGIQADLKTISALGCYGMSAITAITAQNTTGVSGVWPLSIECVEQQIHAVLSDIGVDAIKIGMLWSSEMARSVAAMIKRFSVESVVFDPVMVAQSGDTLFAEDDAVNMIRELSPCSLIVTPNIPEATHLVGREIHDIKDMETAARDLTAMGCSNVLIKGGHLDGDEVVDLLYGSDSDETTLFRGKRIDTRNNHGTGCTLSSAIASFLAHGKNLKTAVDQGKAYITRALAAGSDYETGHGHGPVHHFSELWDLQ